VEPPPVFSPPPPPVVQASPIRVRSETPRDIEISSPIINQNASYPPTPQSPFLPISHNRIRTESLCSIKQPTAANLQPRKKVRNEDQKILDNKRESRERLSDKNVEKSKLRMFDMIYYNPSTNPMKPRPPASRCESVERKPIDLKDEVTPPPTITETALAVPQLRLNAKGEMVLDESSLVVENEEEKKNRILLANTNVVYHDELSANYGYYKRQQRTKEWPQEETIKFYRCLNTVGTDFSLMLNLFPKRSRRDLKLKFKKEEKNNPHLVDKALLKHNTFNVEELRRELEEEDAERQKEAENKSSEVKELVKRKILKKQEAKEQQALSKVGKMLSEGEKVMEVVDGKNVLEIKENVESKAAKRRRQIKRKFEEEVLSKIEQKEEVPLKIEKKNDESSSSGVIVEEKREVKRSKIKPALKPRRFKKEETVTSPALVISDGTENIFSENILYGEEIQNPDNIVADGYTILHLDSAPEAPVSPSAMNLMDNDSNVALQLHPTTTETNVNVYNFEISDFSIPPTSETTSTTETIPVMPLSGDFDTLQPTIFEENLTNNESVQNVESSEKDPSYNENLQSIFDPYNEPEPSTSTQQSKDELASVESPKEDFPVIDDEIDEESYLNSLDLENLAIVVKQIDGKMLYDIHKTDPHTQKISDEPLELPQKIVSLIVSVLSQDDI
jgi:Myb DNA-binding like